MLKKIFTYILNKPLYMKYYKKLEHPTLREQELIEDLNKTFQKLPYEEVADCSQSETIWKKNINTLRELVLTENPRKFLRWNIILNTMFVGNENYVAAELRHLRAKTDWNERWQKAIEEIDTGSPLPFNKYPRSSGNLIHHAYHMSQFEENTGIPVDKIEFVCEFGGGYGCMCKLFHNLGFKGKYVIFDFPHFTALQKYYLKTIGIPVQTFDQFQSADNGVLCISDIEDMKEIIPTNSNYSNSLFIAMWSISETSLHIRNSILPLVSYFDAIFIAYQDNFGEMDNIRFFGIFKQLYEGKMHWSQWKIRHLPGNTYLVGTSMYKEQEPIEDYARTFRELSFKDAANCFYSENIWKQNMSHQRELVLSDRLIIFKDFSKFFLQILEDSIKCTFIYGKVQDYWHEINRRKWELAGRPIPTPHAVKQMTIKEYADQYGTDIFVETGTYLGEMLDAVKYSFKKIYSIELSAELSKRAEKKFSRHKHIEIFEGDSSAVLSEILNYINEPCLFWLDAHYSEGITARGEKETPILDELKRIFNHSINNHIILIDDARCFKGQGDYPALEELKELIINRYPDFVFTVKDDIIRAHRN